MNIRINYQATRVSVRGIGI